MPIEFKKEIITVKYLDPREGFKENDISFEWRADPLTEETGAIYSYRMRKFPRLDLDELDRMSREMGCPFCPESLETATPKFIPAFLPEGRLRVGDACVVPNLMPYSPYNGVAIFSKRHRIDLTDFTPEILMDGFMAAQGYLKRVLSFDPAARYHLVGWNYLPAAGGSLVHPHLQVMGRYIPTQYQKRLLQGSLEYHQKHNTNFWADLIAQEKAAGERYIGATGSTEWINNFIPKSNILDVTGIIPGKATYTDLTHEDLAGFIDGLLRVFKYMNDNELYSFNMSFFCGIRGQKDFYITARLAVRFSPPPLYFSDLPVVPFLHNELFGMIAPEENCRQLKAYFAR